MKKSFLDKIKNISVFWWIFLSVVIVGIFLRSYNHHDWLRFNADQGRDAEIVSTAVDGLAPFPSLGPKAGGTQFRLGAAFYYFEIASAKIFGNYPDKMAYPDLFTSILCMPLLFFFLRKYFKKNTSLFLTAIFAVSSYAVFYSRFAWNPNSSPFWTILFLYAIHEVISEGNDRKYAWAVIAGIAIGIGVQLHTTLLVILPIFTILVFAYFSFRNAKIIKYFLMILVISLLLNIPQIISECQTSGKNIQAFFGGLKIKQQSENSVTSNVLQSTSCFIQGSTYILSGYEISDKCSFIWGKDQKDTRVFLFGSIFVLGGLIIGLRYFFNETDPDRKRFLGIIFVFFAVAYLVFSKMAFELSVRFYLPLIFLPFLSLGFWLRFFREKFNVRENIILFIVCVPLIFSNLYFVQKSFAALANYGNAGGGSADVVILKEAEVFSQFIINNANNGEIAYIGGDGKFLFKGYKSIRFLVRKSNIDLRMVNKNTQLQNQYFYVSSLKKKEKMLKDESIKIFQYKTYGNFALLLVQNI